MAVSQETQPKKKLSKGCLIALIILLGLIMVGFVTCAVTCITAPDTSVELSPNIRFDGTQFHITNNNDFDWVNVTFKVNSVYKLNASLIAAKTEYTVGAMQFAKDDGTRFNPFTTKANDIYISADTVDNRHGSWAGSW